MADSICKLNDNYIGIGLQKYDENNIDGIAVLDIREREIVNIIQGLSIGLLNNSLIKNKFIFFSTNQTREIKKANIIRLYKKDDIFKDNISKDKDKIILQITSTFNCLTEIIPFKDKSQNLYYAVSSDKSLYIILLKNNME